MRLPVNFESKLLKHSDQNWVSEAVPSIIAQSWLWGSQIAVKKKRRSKFAQTNGQFVNRHGHIQADRKLMLSHLNRHVCNLKIQIKAHYDLDMLLAFSGSEIRFKLLRKRLLS